MVEKYQHCNDKGFQGEQFVKKWFIDRWASEVDKKSSLKFIMGNGIIKKKPTLMAQKKLDGSLV